MTDTNSQTICTDQQLTDANSQTICTDQQLTDTNSQTICTDQQEATEIKDYRPQVQVNNSKHKSVSPKSGNQNNKN